MPSRVVARKSARLIPLVPSEYPYFHPRGEIPVNSANTSSARAGVYRAKLVAITTVYNQALAPLGGLPHKCMYAWVYRTLQEREPWLFENGVDVDGDAYEFVFYTGTEIGDPVASLTRHVGDFIGEVPDPDVLEAVGLLRLIGSNACVVVKHGKYVIPSHTADFAWNSEVSHIKHGLHMTRLAADMTEGVKVQSTWRLELEARAQARAAKMRRPEAVTLRITKDEDG